MRCKNHLLLNAQNVLFNIVRIWKLSWLFAYNRTTLVSQVYCVASFYVITISKYS